MKKPVLLITIFLLLTLTGLFVYPKFQPPPYSPLSLADFPLSSPPSQFSLTLGFLPFWNLSRLNPLELIPFTDLAYFGIELNPDGTTKKLATPQAEEPGWTKLKTGLYPTLKNQTDNKLRHHLVIRAMNNNTIESILATTSNQQTAVTEILQLISQYKFAGINLDFEYHGTPSPTTINQFTQFTALVRQQLNTNYPNTLLTVDVFANAAAKHRLWDLPRLVPLVDYIIIMGYDFNRASSVTTGAVAPLTGSWDCQPNSPTNPCTYTYDLTTALNDYLLLAPANKLVLALPLYGYEWQTNSPIPRANTIPQTGSLATINRVSQLISDKCGLIHLRRCPQYLDYNNFTTDLDQNTLYQSWDPTAHSPLLIFYDQTESTWHQIYYENTKSLAHKLQLASNLDLAGIAYWALGYR